MSGTFDLNELAEIKNNIYETVILSAKRARQIHNKMADDLKKQLGEVENEEDLDEEIIDREKIVKKFDEMPKPSITAINEFLNGKLHISSDEEEKK